MSVREKERLYAFVPVYVCARVCVFICMMHARYCVFTCRG